MRHLIRGQGATEYLVLLAVVLIIALVGIALLGFFPGTASDAQITESQIYWKGASPVAITDAGGRVAASNGETYAYLFIKNTGSYPIRLTGIIGGDGGKMTQFYSDSTSPCVPSVTATYNIADYYYMAPGEEKYFITDWMHGGSYCRRHITFATSGTGSNRVGGATTVCQNSSSAPGAISFSSFGFEYIQYVENQQIVKRQIGKALVAKCRPT